MRKRYLIKVQCINCKKERMAHKWSHGDLCSHCSRSISKLKRGKTGPRTSLVGKKYNMLTVLAQEGINKEGKYLWLCRCECGNEKKLTGTILKSGSSKSCGCIVRTQKGLANTSIYSIWHSMVARCHNKNSRSWKRYGGRGIIVCDRWKNSFFNFLEDMGDRPKGMSIDRINNNGNYCKENCRWATMMEQARNTSKNHIIEAFGKKMTLIEWVRDTGHAPDVIKKRLKRGLSIEEALYKGSIAKHGEDSIFEAFGESKTLGEWGKIKGLKVSTIRSRLLKNIPIEEALCSEIRPGKRITAFGKSLKISEWESEAGIDRGTLFNRLKRGWTPEEALTLKPDLGKKINKKLKAFKSVV